MTTAETKQSLFPPREEREGHNEQGKWRGGWGLFGYEGTMCERAISVDRVDMIVECFERGWINPNSTTMMGETIPEFCDKKGASKCAAKLRELGLS